jgi:hypothetical protein
MAPIATELSHKGQDEAASGRIGKRTADLVQRTQREAGMRKRVVDFSNAGLQSKWPRLIARPLYRADEFSQFREATRAGGVKERFVHVLFYERIDDRVKTASPRQLDRSFDWVFSGVAPGPSPGGSGDFSTCVAVGTE